MLFDGHDGCGCILDDFIPCGGDNILECQAAKVVKCTSECDHGEKVDEHYEPMK